MRAQIIRLSFHQYQHDATVPALEEELADIHEQLRASEKLDTDEREASATPAPSARPPARPPTATTYSRVPTQRGVPIL